MFHKLFFLKALFSPFKPFKLKFYFGRIAIGTPYFYPRKWVYYTKKEAIDLANKKKYPNDISDEAKQKLFNNAVKSYQKTQYPVTKKIGFNLVGLGWKTKWSNTDYRFEWAPLVSFVFFKLQIAIMFIAPEQDHYWEAWLFYERNIDKSKSKDEKIQICMNEYPLNYIQYKNGKETKINYYKLILKEKYLKYIKD